MEEPALYGRNSAHCKAHLGVVDPALGVLARDIEPVGRGPVAAPGDRSPRRVEVERRERIINFWTDERQQFDRYVGRYPSRGAHPFIVGALDEHREVVDRQAALAGGLARGSAEPAEVTAEQVERNVVDVPAGVGREGRPTRLVDRAQKAEQLGPIRRDQRAKVDGRQIP